MRELKTEREKGREIPYMSRERDIKKKEKDQGEREGERRGKGKIERDGGNKMGWNGFRISRQNRLIIRPKLQVAFETFT